MKKLFTLPTLILLVMVSLVTLESNAQKQSEFMKLMATEMNKSCPAEAGAGMVMTKISYLDNYFVFNFTNDETTATMAEIINNKSVFKNTLLSTMSEGFKEPTVAALLKDSKTGFKFNIRGKISGRSCTFTVTNAELLNAIGY